MYVVKAGLGYCLNVRIHSTNTKRDTITRKLAFQFYTLSQRNIPNIFDSNLNKNYQIFIILKQLAIK